MNTQNTEIIGNSPHLMIFVSRVKDILRGLRLTSAEKVVDIVKNETKQTTTRKLEKNVFRVGFHGCKNVLTVHDNPLENYK